MDQYQIPALNEPTDEYELAIERLKAQKEHLEVQAVKDASTFLPLTPFMLK